MPTRSEAWPAGTPCWVDLMVDDADKVSSFYTALFGWELAPGSEEVGGYRVAMLNGKSAAGLGPKPADMPMPTVWTTYIASDDADASAEAITAAGGQVMMPTMDITDVGRMLVAADPTGAVFAIWQSKLHNGGEIFNENGAWCWNEVHTRGYADAQKFYSDVFGWSFTEVGDGKTFTYSTFALPGAQAPVGGCNDLALMQNGAPAHWLTWFAADSVDDMTAKVTELGGKVVMPPSATPFGRMAIVSGIEGEFFGLINVSQTTTE